MKKLLMLAVVIAFGAVGVANAEGLGRPNFGRPNPDSSSFGVTVPDPSETGTQPIPNDFCGNIIPLTGTEWACAKYPECCPSTDELEEFCKLFPDSCK